MARQFSGSSQYLQSSAPVDLSGYAKLTLACWLWWNTFANDDAFLMELSSNFNSVTDGFVIDPDDAGNNGGGQFGAGFRGNVGYSYATFPRPSAGAWHHYVFCFDKSKSGNEVDSVWVDGVSQSLTFSFNSDNTNNFGNYTLNFMSRNGASQFAAGRLAEVAIWPGVLLDANEIAALAKGFAPALIRPAALGWYWPLLTQQNPESELRKGNGATVTGATPIDHPAVLYPAPPLENGTGALPLPTGNPMRSFAAFAAVLTSLAAKAQPSTTFIAPASSP